MTATKPAHTINRMEAAQRARESMDLQDLTTAATKGMHPPEVGVCGVYEPPGGGISTFQVVAVKGMICQCRYSWQSERDDPSCFIWGFLRDTQHNRYHVWPGHPEWGV